MGQYRLMFSPLWLEKKELARNNSRIPDPNGGLTQWGNKTYVQQIQVMRVFTNQMHLGPRNHILSLDHVFLFVN